MPQRDLEHGDSAPFVFVHGGRHGGWCWQRVVERLRRRGHMTYAPSLSGLGDRAHLLSREIGLAVHVQDVVSLFDYEDITGAILVAHSYGGMVVSGAMESIADRVRSLVFLDAHMPLPGESLFDLLQPENVTLLLAQADAHGDGWRIPVCDAGFWGVTEQVDKDWVNPRITPQPLKTYLDPVGPTGRAWQSAGMFIECRRSTGSATPAHITRPRERSQKDERFLYRILDSTHDAMITAPGDVTKLLLEAAMIPVI